jgi:hypothetical protein
MFSYCILPNQAEFQVNAPKVGQSMQELRLVEQTLTLQFSAFP